MGGRPDGLGAYDNNDGTFTLLVNHEWTAGSGVAHGVLAAWTCVSQWKIDKSDLSVVSWGNLIQKVSTWNGSTQSSNPAISNAAAIALNRLCSADLPSLTGLSYTDTQTNTVYGTTERLFLNGEEGGASSRALATVVTGADAGTAYVLGKFDPTTNGSE